MRRLLLPLLGLALLTLGALVSPLVVAFVGLRPLTEADFDEGGAQIVDGYVSVSLLPLEDGKWMLIDCGDDPEGAAILAALAARGASADSVQAIFLTHGHPDHVAGCPQFTESLVYGMSAEQPFLSGEAPYRAPLPRLAGTTDSGVRVQRPVRDSETIHVGGRTIVAFAVPGHTAGSAAYLTDGRLFLGDSATIESDGDLRPAPWVFSEFTKQNLQSLHSLAYKIQGQDVRALVPSHSGTADSSAPLDAWLDL